ncbi:type IV pilus modification PilV family protein [Undibacterium sp. TJN25]|uniref:type IV pilus modification PilV family protein n=1 Tax=Undibacterium sp. TJN25 TaxID=3413056 RepID=UPI003BEFE545
MKNNFRYLARTRQRGIVLLEALIAIFIFSIGILGIVGLQASMIKGTSDTKYRIEATNIAEQRVSQIWLDQGNLANYGEVATDISGSTGLPNGKRTTVRGDASCGTDPSLLLSCFVVTVTWQQPNTNNTDLHNVTIVSHIAGG